MDEEEGRGSLGAYENMERSDIRPEFLSEENKEDGAKEKLRQGESAAVNAGIQAGLNAATGGAAGAAVKAAEGAGAAAKGLSKSGDGQSSGATGRGGKDQGKLKGKATIKKAAPMIVIIVLIVVLYGIISFIGQWLYPFGFIARIREDWNSSKTTNTKRTDDLMNSVQLCGDSDSSKYGNVIFEDTNLTESQISDFKDAGFDVKDCSLVFGDTVIVPDVKVGVLPEEELAESGVTVQDSGSIYTGEELEEIKAQILADLDIAADGGHVLGFSEAMKNWTIKERYMIATRSYRGDVSGWHTSAGELTQQRQATSRNIWKDYENTGNVAENYEIFHSTLDGKSYNVPDSGEKSTKELIEEVAENSGNSNAALASAVEKTEGVANGETVAKEMQAVAPWLEAIDKSKAGEGTGAPLSEMNNYIVQSGAADTESMHFLFGSGELDTSDQALLIANPSVNSTVTVHANEDEEYRSNHYTSNMNYKGKTGAIATIASIINNFVSKIKSIFSRSKGGADAGAVEAQMGAAVGNLEAARAQEYFTGDYTDGKVLGEALYAAAAREHSGQAQTIGQTSGNAEATYAFKREQAEVIAEQAEFDRRTSSPFDITNEHTFLGSIMYSLIPMATSTQAVSATTAVGDLGSLVSNAMSNLLPSSSAISELELMQSVGDCATANSGGGMSAGQCIDYMNSDLSTTKEQPVKIFDTVADLRYDKKGYVYGNKDEGLHWGGADTSDPDYGDGPINEAESSMGSHWGADLPAWPNDAIEEPHGCESDWVVVVDNFGLVGPVGKKYYHFGQPVEWSYSRVTNFEYDGYESGWRNRLRGGATGMEDAKNDEDPGECELDFTERTDDGQPIINQNGALMAYITLSGQRGSGKGTADDGNVQFLKNSDFIKGRLHPCKVGGSSFHVCEEYSETGEDSLYDGWDGTDDGTASSEYISRYISGVAQVIKNEDYDGTIPHDIYEQEHGDDIYKDKTMDDDYFWNEMRWYQAYVEMLTWLETIGKINQSGATLAVLDYWDEHPLDQSHAGIVARYSGLKTETVLAVYRLADHLEFLAQYDPSTLGPLPVETEEFYYESPEVVAQMEQATQAMGVVYDELRNRTVAA